MEGRVPCKLIRNFLLTKQICFPFSKFCQQFSIFMSTASLLSVIRIMVPAISFYHENFLTQTSAVRELSRHIQFYASQRVNGNYLSSSRQILFPFCRAFLGWLPGTISFKLEIRPGSTNRVTMSKYTIRVSDGGVNPHPNTY
jgi:hypothetical protein